MNTDNSSKVREITNHSEPKEKWIQTVCLFKSYLLQLWKFGIVSFVTWSVLVLIPLLWVCWARLLSLTDQVALVKLNTRIPWSTVVTLEGNRQMHSAYLLSHCLRKNKWSSHICLKLCSNLEDLTLSFKFKHKTKCARLVTYRFNEASSLQCFRLQCPKNKKNIIEVEFKCPII